MIAMEVKSDVGVVCAAPRFMQHGVGVGARVCIPREPEVLQ